MWWDRDYVTFDTTTYEILTAGNAENSKSMNFSGNIMYRPMPLATVSYTNLTLPTILLV